jgi:hypothetical protein
VGFSTSNFRLSIEKGPARGKEFQRSNFEVRIKRIDEADFMGKTASIRPFSETAF